MMNWRVTAKEWQPNQTRKLNREGAKIVDEQEGRRRLTANELNAFMCARTSWLMLDMAIEHLERQADHVGVWWRLKWLHSQMQGIHKKMLDKISLEQVVSIKNNTQNMKISLVPEKLPSEKEKVILNLTDYDRILCAALSYCQYHCDGDCKTSRNCPIKAMLDDNCYIQECDFSGLLDGNTCKYNMVDVAWERINKEADW